MTRPHFAAVLDDVLFSVDGIELKHTIDSAIDEVRSEYDTYKDFYNLPRPFVINDQVHPVTDAPRRVLPQRARDTCRRLRKVAGGGFSRAPRCPDGAC